jgi:lactose/L-arabinose transport system permease protein
MKPKSLEQRTSIFGWVFVAPATLLFVIFFAYPLAQSLWQSFTTREAGADIWHGIANYERLSNDPLVLKSLQTAGLILAVQMPLMIVLSVGLAFLLNSSWLKFKTTFRLIHFLPAVTTLVAYSLVFRIMLQSDGGIVNQFLQAINLPSIDWLNSTFWAPISVIASVTWRWTGYNMVFVLAGLQAIPKEQYESATLDGASNLRTFFSIVLPQLRPVLIFVTITSTIGSLQLFDENYILTGGGPANATITPVLLMYKTGFRDFDFGYASAIAWMLVALIGLLSVLQFRLLRERN